MDEKNEFEGFSENAIKGDIERISGTMIDILKQIDEIRVDYNTRIESLHNDIQNIKKSLRLILDVIKEGEGKNVKT